MATVPLSRTHGKQTAPATPHGVQQSLVPPLPPISPDLRLRLKEDISRRGILVPILISQDGECLDGRAATWRSPRNLVSPQEQSRRSWSGGSPQPSERTFAWY